MKKILIINGPNLNMLGMRDNHHYGKLTLNKINSLLSQIAKQNRVGLIFFQSNHEGKLIDYIQKQTVKVSGIVINPGAFTHYSYAIRDALADTKLPIVEVHLSDVDNREDFRKKDVLDGIVLKKISGLKEKSYTTGLKHLINHINKV